MKNLNPIRSIIRKTMPNVALALVASIASGTYANASDQRGYNFLPSTISIAAPSGARNICTTYKWACAVSSKSGRMTRQNLELVRRVNRGVNSQNREISDSAQYRQAELWALPTIRGGDCEDFALLKKRELIRLGIDPKRLLLATVLDRGRKSHAVLVLRSDDGDYVLDNLTNSILDWRNTRYTFLRMQNPDAPSSWVGVFRGG